MTENRLSFKSFNHAEPRGAELPPLLAALLVGHELFRNLDDYDLREMSKFGEIPNVEGLAAHAVARPAPADLDLEAAGNGLPEIPERIGDGLRRELGRAPSVMVTGALGGACARPVRVGAIVPQSHAHLAQTLRRMLWPAAGGAPLDFTLFVWPDALRRKNGTVVVESLIGHWPGEGMGVVIGYDDPALAARMLTAAARRIWAAEERDEGRGAGDEGYGAWDEFLNEKDRSTPLWANPLLPAGVLARRAEWRAAALAVGALPLGVAVDEEGRFPLFHGPGAGEGSGASEDSSAGILPASSGWVVVPREALAHLKI